MQNNDSYRQICGQYPPDDGTYPFDNWKQSGGIQFRKFSGKNCEARFLKQLLSKKLAEGIFFQRIVVELQEKNIPVAGQLIWFTGCLEKKFTSYARSENSTCGYYQPILNALKQFCSVTHGFREKMQKAAAAVAYASKQQQAHTAVNPCFDREDLEDFLFEMQFFSHQLSRFNDCFMMLLDRETDKGKGKNVTTQVELYLLKLLGFIQEMMIHSQEMEGRLEAQLTHCSMLENQRWYN